MRYAMYSVLLMLSATAAAQDVTADSVMSALKLQTSVQTINARTSCATPASKRDPDTIVVCGKRESSRYRYGQRGQPYSSKYKGLTPQQVANAVAGITFDPPMAGERAYNHFEALNNEQRSHLGLAPGLAGILDPLNLGYGTSRTSRDVFFGLQQDEDAGF